MEFLQPFCCLLSLPKRPLYQPQTTIIHGDAAQSRLINEFPEPLHRGIRILLVGRPGVGKTSLIYAIFKTSLADDSQNRAEAANINEEIASANNRHLILHDSQGCEPGDGEKCDILAKFLTEQTERQSPAERLRAIWLCIPASYSGGRLFETEDENIFKLNRNRVPIIVVVTKFDLFVGGMVKDPNSWQVAEQKFKHIFGHEFDKGSVNRDRPIPYALVSKSQPNTLQRLVQITVDNIRDEISGPSIGPAHDRNLSCDRILQNNQSSESDESIPRWGLVALAMAQHVDMTSRIEASINVGKKKYWKVIASAKHLLNISLENCLHAIHKDIIAIWNFQDLHEFLLSDAFRHRVMAIVEDLKDTNTTQSRRTVVSGQAGLVATRVPPAVGVLAQAGAIYKNGSEHVRCLMGYVVDLTLILQVMFQLSLQDQYEGRVTVDHVDEILYEFHSSERKRVIHHAIRTFAWRPFAKDNVVEKIRSLLDENQMSQTDIQLNKDRPPLRSLLRILIFEITVNGLVVNRIILGLVRELLELPDLHSIVPRMDPLDIELLLDFILYLLQNDHLSTCGMPDANRKARKLMAKLISEANVIPQSLYITNVSFDADSSPIGIGNRGRVLKGKYEGEVVALKVLYNFDKGQRDLFREFRKESLVWRTLKHDFILPLLGIFKEQKLEFLVSPLMPNGTLSEWRKHQPAAVIPKIHMLISEVAQGVQYMHSEGIVHGSLTGDNILLDSDFHCRIGGFGLVRHSDATSTGTVIYSPNFAAPELFDSRTWKKTMETDVYAFGCLYYAIFFDTVPYEGEPPFRISWLVTTGERPARLVNPTMEDSTWNLINDCWKFCASERPTVHDITRALEALASSLSLLPTLPSLSVALTSLLGTIHEAATSCGRSEAFLI